MSSSNFLTAEWRKLALANYAVDPDLLKPFLPAGTELDLWNGQCFVSLAGFMFLRTKLKGIPIPWHTNFEEVNLRFYVRHLDGGQWKRGVVFIKEIVPKAALTFVARRFYNEPYVTMPMRHCWQQDEYRLSVNYDWRSARWNSFAVTASPVSQPIGEGSDEEFITEHYWGYTRLRANVTSQYEVTHPRWEVYPVQSHGTDVDFGALYGPQFAFLARQAPQSVMLAEGSAIAVKVCKPLVFSGPF